jgi:hypothetical protein
MKRYQEFWILVGAAVAAGGLSYAGVRHVAPKPLARELAAPSVGTNSEFSEDATPAVTIGARPILMREIVLVVVGGSICNFSRARHLRPFVDSLRLKLSAEAAQRGIVFTTVGVSVDVQAKDGIAYLASLGTFDEIVAGGTWRNTGVLYYVRNNMAGPLATPQIVVIERSSFATATPDVAVRETLRLRVTGLGGLQGLRATGFRVPSLSPLGAGQAVTESALGVATAR